MAAAHPGVLGPEAEDLWAKGLEVGSARPARDDLRHGQSGCDKIIER